MNEENPGSNSAEVAAQIFRQKLASGDVAIASARPVLRHLLANRDSSLFSDEVIARVNGMILHIARQLLQARALAENSAETPLVDGDEEQELAHLLTQDAAFLAHAHALTLEVQLTDKLQRRSGIDHVLVPLLQDHSASSDKPVAGEAIRMMAAQARFIQQQRRMELPLGELPGDLLHKALLLMRNQAGDSDAAEIAEAKLRVEYDEGRSRLGQITRLVMGMGDNANRALLIKHAGLAIFATALAMASGQDRNLTILSFGENQLARLALALRAAGLDKEAVEEQFLYIHPEVPMPADLSAMSIEHAAALLADTQTEVIG